MATAATIKKNIAKLEAALKSKATPKSLKSKLETQLVKSKAELSGINKGSKPKTSTSKSAQTALQKLKEMVNKNKKLKTYKKSGVDLEKDADRPALPIGRRTAKQSGKTYYEYRANRIDVKQPPKRYPKLEDGGKLEGYKDLSKVNSSKIEVVETTAYGTPDKLILKFDGNKIAQFYYNTRGYNRDFVLKNSEGEFYIFANEKPKGAQVTEFKKALKQGYTFLKYYDKMEKGGYMAHGGELAAKKRLEELREELRAERISYGELAELQELSEYIDKDDVELLEAAGVPENDEDEYADGGYVAVSEKNDYWTIITKPTTKEKAQEMLDLGGLPRGEVGKVVTLEEAKAHKNTIGKEYLEKGGYFAKGGAMEHGLMVGDTVRDVAENSVAIYNINNRKSFVVDLDKGTRTEWIGSFKDRKKYAEKGAYMAMGGEMHRTQE